MRITLDTNVLVGGHDAAFGESRRLLLRILRHGHRLVLSQSILYELEEVLYYPRMKQRYELTGEEIRAYVAFLAHVAELVDLGSLRHLPLTDVDDWVVLRTAIEGGVDILCSADGGFHKTRVVQFCAQYEILVLKPSTLLRRLAAH
ncbi:MAG: putative toxin-antitoxin system toxin component, PIN family [Bryobacteraceae bacterium]